MGESLNLISYVSNSLLSRYFTSDFLQVTSLNVNKVFNKNNHNNSYSSMEDLIEHFINWHTGFKVKKTTNIAYIESPKGEFGVILTGDGSEKPARCKIRSPSYFNLQILPKLSKGHYLSDLAALIGTIDIVFGEVDR